MLDRITNAQGVTEMKITDHDIERRLKFVGLSSDDAGRIAKIKPIVVNGVEELTSVFFDFLGSLPETKPLLARSEFVNEARRLKREHLLAMVEGVYGREYVEQRMRLGFLYSRAGLDIRIFLGAFHELMRSIGNRVIKKYEHKVEEGFQSFMSLKKVAFFDLGVIVDVLIYEGSERVIRMQREAIRELSTPVLPIRDRLLILPIIGTIDTYRARQLTENLLAGIRENRAKVVVMDITGVAAVDSKVANHLLQTVAAARLMGATLIVTGLSADVAQSLVGLGVDLSRLNTMGDLQGGLEEAERLLGYRISMADAVRAHAAEKSN
jgi:rsbT co-antagonist protein RsbR